MTRRATKIVATAGPSCSSPTMVRRAIEAGVDVVRLNFSHGSHDDHGKVITRVRREAKRAGRHVAILADLMGPKIRIGAIERGAIELVPGKPFTITARSVPGDASVVSTTYKPLAQDVAVGDPILLDDGRLVLRVTRIDGSDVHTEVESGGKLTSNKGLTIPSGSLSAEAITAKDRRDLEFAVSCGVDFVALSFVRSHTDVQKVQRAIKRFGADTPVIAKLERKEAIDDLHAVLRVSDAIMIARGDLGVEMRVEEVPILQKSIIQAASRAGVPVITATQMLESMIELPRPTRAEASDVANAVLDGTDAVMLSGETAAGNYPIQAIEVMDRIVRQAEESSYFAPARRLAQLEEASGSEFLAVARAATAARREARAIAIVAFTASGATARLLSKLRPEVPVFAVNPHERMCRQLNLRWGIHPVQSAFGQSSDAMIRRGEKALLACGWLKRGDVIVEIAGKTPHVHATDMMSVLKIGMR